MTNLPSTNYPLALPEEADNLEGFLLFQEQLGIAWDDAVDARARVAYHLHMILEYELFRHETESVKEDVTIVSGVGKLLSIPISKGTIKSTDPLGNEVTINMDGDIARPNGYDSGVLSVEYQYRKYPKQKDYLEHLRTKFGQGISTVKQDHRALRFANHLEFDSLEEMLEVGMPVLSAASNGFNVDPQSGEPFSLKSGELPEGQTAKGYARHVVDELASKQEELSPSDFFHERERLLRPGVPQVRVERKRDHSTWWVSEFYRDDTHDFQTGEIIVDVDENGMTITFGNSVSKNTLPDEVGDYVRKQLRI